MNFNISNEVKVGLTVFLALVVAIIGFRFMRDIPIFSRSMVVIAEFEKADGIASGSLVYVKGVRVGSVRSVNLTEDLVVNVNMALDTELPIPRESVAVLTSLSIVEGKSIVIELGSSNEFIESGDHIEGRYAESMMEVIGEKGNDIGDDVSGTLSELNVFLQQLNSTLNDSTRENIDRTVEGAMKTATDLSEILENKQADIENAIGAGSTMIQQLDTLSRDARPRVDSLMVSLENNLQDLERLQVKMESATANLDQILEKINNGDGTIGKLVNDSSMYENIDSLTIELNALIRGINEDPGRYLKNMSVIEIF
jgi:ABC-type transporter Mla subunit MlaD